MMWRSFTSTIGRLPGLGHEIFAAPRSMDGLGEGKAPVNVVRVLGRDVGP